MQNLISWTDAAGESSSWSRWIPAFAGMTAGGSVL